MILKFLKKIFTMGGAAVDSYTEIIKEKKFINQLRVRIILLVLVVIFVVYGAGVLVYIAHRNAMATSTETLARLAVISTVADVKSVTENAHQILSVITELPAVMRHEHRVNECSKVLGDILRESPWYINIGVADARGNIYCSAVPFEGSVNVSDRLYFRNAVATKEFSIGEYQMGRITRQLSINFSHPMLDEDGEVTGVVFAALNLQRFEYETSDVKFLPEASIKIFDEDGTLIMSYPRFGKAEDFDRDAPEFEVLSGADLSGSGQLVKNLEVNGSDRMFALQKIFQAGDKQIYTSVSFSRDSLFKEIDAIFIRGSLWLIAIALAAIILAWFIQGFLVTPKLLELQAVDRLKNEFVSLASHQLRTPISIINLYASLLASEDGGKPSRNQKKYLKEIEKGGKRMTDLIDMILNVAKIDLGTFGGEPKPTNIAEVARGVLEDFAPQIRAKDIRLDFRHGDDIPLLWLDPKLAQIIFQNLVSNSIKYTEHGGKIDVKIEKTGPGLLITFADNGCGIPRGQQSRIFTKMFRADNAKEKVTDGTGLGLYIVKSVVDKLNGKIWFKSEENKGTVFSITLPLASRSNQ